MYSLSSTCIITIESNTEIICCTNAMCLSFLEHHGDDKCEELAMYIPFNNAS